MNEKVYLDTSVYNRPFDDQKQARIWLETLAFTSSVLAYETSRNPYEQRREWVSRVSQLARIYQLVDEPIRQRANALAANRIKSFDALHIACAETAVADYFVTCDDHLIRRYRSLASFTMIICNPPEFVRLVTGIDP